jgi:hypothetical protein
MRLRACALATAIAVFCAGCVIAPVRRTYYEPNPADGTPTRSASCGYNRTANDGLERSFDGMTISVFPEYKEGRPLRVYVLLGRTTKAIEVNPDKVQLRIGTSTAAFWPTKVDVQDAAPVFYKSIDLTFSAAAPEAQEISLVLLPGFITLDHIAVELAPFRFHKVTKMDVYYNSINC